VKLFQFSTSWCFPCKKAREIIEEKYDIKDNYEFIDVEKTTDEKIKSLIQVLKIRSVPHFALVEGNVVFDSFKGLDLQKIEECVKQIKDEV